MGIIKKDKPSPILRFKFFNSSWELKNLHALGNTYAGLTGKKAADFNRGNAFFITYKQVYDSPTIEKARGKVQVSPSEKQNRVKFGDLLVTASSETPDEVGMTAVFINKNSRPYLNSFCFGFRPHSLRVLDPYFARYLFRSPAIRRKIIKLAQGSTRFNISRSAFLQLKIYLPSLPEQRKIAAFFSTLDDLIENIKKQKEKLEELKKGLMQRLFPKKGERIPELRFKGLEGEWREVRLGDIVEIRKGKQLGKKFLKGKDSKGYKYPVYNGGKLPSGYFKQYNVKAHSLIVSEGGNSAGFVNWISVDFWAGGHCFILKKRGSKGFVYRFLYFYLKHEEPKLMALRVGSGLPNIQLKDINRFVIFLPSLEEQFKLTRLFNGLDELLRTKRRLLQNLLNLRKALLQRMFI